jgi:hypothetical protein
VSLEIETRIEPAPAFKPEGVSEGISARRRLRPICRCLPPLALALGSLLLLLHLLGPGNRATAGTILETQPALDVDRQQPSDSPAISPTHLGYGANVRDPAHLNELFAPLGLEWVKLYEQYDALPHSRLPFKVLYRIQLNGPPPDLVAWGAHVEAVARAGKGLVEAYEIGNEPNQSWQWGHQVPDPAEYVAALEIAYNRIKAVDPEAVVVSAGLGPVGRVKATPNGEGWPGNNGLSMDEWEYAGAVFSRCVTGCFDVFGYHPFGFAYTPEADPDTVPENFAFRGAEDLRQIMLDHGLANKPMWATEFGWIRDPDADGLGLCKFVPEFNDHFGWMLVTELQQADYLSRAFAYADTHWPWMGAMFLWNLDWNDQGWICDNIRFFSLRYVSGEVAPAYDTLAEMAKRPAPFGCRFVVDAQEYAYEVEVDRPIMISESVNLLDMGGCDVYTWTVSVAPGSTLQPHMAITQARLGHPLTFSVDTGAFMTRGTGTLLLYPPGVYTTLLTFRTPANELLGEAHAVPIVLAVLPGPYRSFLPVLLQN